MQDGAGCGAGPGPTPPNPAALPAAAILPRADWSARPARPAPLPRRRGARPGGTEARAPRGRAARSDSPPGLRGHKEPRLLRPRSLLEDERIDLSQAAGQGASEVRTGCRIRAGKCPHGALPIPSSSEVQNSPVLGLPHRPSIAHPEQPPSESQLEEHLCTAVKSCGSGKLPCQKQAASTKTESPENRSSSCQNCEQQGLVPEDMASLVTPDSKNSCLHHGLPVQLTSALHWQLAKLRLFL
ncbi:uncharacterized protein LOC115484158 [Serinus canaria]|uniref:uncharacterized protein LOC115484158 n=1 Tax=Serinus canaria TaxID=9135 RepID=UPI0021CC9A67|nr:uncharacterized protein LOC115484158 [Serinus canaria]